MAKRTDADQKEHMPQALPTVAAVLLAAAVLIAACSTMADLATESAGESIPPPSGETATYRTRLFEQLGLPGPSLTFEYPDGWHVAEEECRPQMFSERVVLESETGRQVSLTVGTAIPSTSGYTTDTLGEVKFNPEPYPGLALPDAVPEYDRLEQTGNEIRAMKLQVRRWERPEHLGEGRGYYVTDADGNDPYYYGRFQFMCLGLASQDGIDFSPDEEDEVMQILCSLRQEPAPYDEQLAEEMEEAYRSLPGSYLYSEDDGDGHIYMDIWQLDENGSAANMGRMSKWDYTWRLTGERDSLGRMLVLLEPTSGNPVEEAETLAFDGNLNALCELGSATAKYPRASDG